MATPTPLPVERSGSGEPGLRRSWQHSFIKHRGPRPSLLSPEEMIPIYDPQSREMSLTPVASGPTQPQETPVQPQTQRNPCCRFFEAIFATRQLAHKSDRKTYIQYTVRELIVYVLYLTILCIVTFSLTSPTTFYYTKVMYDLFIDEPFPNEEQTSFRTSNNIKDFWKFTREVLPRGLHWKPLAGGGTTNGPSTADRTVSDPNALFENKIMGVARFRQIRVTSERCLVSESYSHLDRTCFLPYEERFEDKGIDGKWNGTDNCKEAPDRLNYKSEEELGGSSHWGRLATYSGAGAVQNLGRDQIATQDIINCLEKNSWVDRSTRVIFLDFTTYNANINLFCVVKLVWEFPATGSMLTSWSLRTVRLISYLTDFEKYVVFSCEILFTIFTVYYLIQEIVEFFQLSWREYFGDIWTWLDLAILIISMCCIGFRIYRKSVVDTTLETLTQDEAVFHDFEFLGYWETQFNHAASVCIFFAWVKIFKYISFNKTMTQLSSTLSRCAKDIGGFAIMFFIVFFAFAQLGFLLFGSQVRDFSTFIDSIFTLLRLILGDFNFRQLEAANRVLGPIFFLAYVFFVFFVLLNMFLAIINDTYSEVKAEIQAQRNEFEIADYIKSGINRVRGIFGKRNEKLDAENAVKLAAADGQITYDELRDNLKASHFTDVEIEMFLARYELDQDRALDEEETQQVLADLEGKRLVTDKEKGSADLSPSVQAVYDPGLNKEADLNIEEFNDVVRRVEVMETTMGGINQKLDQIMERIKSTVKPPTPLPKADNKADPTV